MTALPPPDPRRDDPIPEMRARQERERLKAKAFEDEISASRLSNTVNQTFILLGILLGVVIGIVADVLLWEDILRDVHPKFVFWVFLAPPAIGLVVGGTIGAYLGRSFHIAKNKLLRRKD
jgi:hypothetical protein